MVVVFVFLAHALRQARNDEVTGRVGWLVTTQTGTIFQISAVGDDMPVITVHCINTNIEIKPPTSPPQDMSGTNKKNDKGKEASETKQAAVSTEVEAKRTPSHHPQQQMLPLTLQTGIGSVAPTAPTSIADFTDTKGLLNMCINLAMGERFHQYAAQLNRACLLHGGFDARTLDVLATAVVVDDAPETESKAQDEHSQVWRMLMNLTELSALKAACMDREFWENVEARQAELAPRLQYYMSPQFLQVLHVQTKAERSRLLDALYASMAATSRDTKNLVKTMSAQERKRAYDMVVAADHKWRKWKPYDVSSKELHDIVQDRAADLHLDPASGSDNEEPIDLARIIHEVASVHQTLHDNDDGGAASDTSGATASTSTGAGAGAPSSATRRARKQAKPKQHGGPPLV